MQAIGHVGVGFMVAAPLVIALDAAGLGAIALPASGLLVGLSTLPDVDHLVSAIDHRGATHSLPFALAVGLVAGGVGWLLGPAIVGVDRLAVGLVAATSGFLAVVSHLLADVVTPMGVFLLWPLSRKRRTLDLVLSADHTVNRALFGAGLACWIAVQLVTGSL